MMRCLIETDVPGLGLLYECSFFVAAAAPDYRYSHWLVTCTCIALVAIAWRPRARYSNSSISASRSA